MLRAGPVTRGGGSRGLLGRLARAPLRLIPEGAVVPVLSGPMRGMRWVAGSAPHGAWLGMLERGALRRFVARLRPGMIVWDVGANVGLYTLPSARAVGPAGRVHAFEPMPANLRLLRRHLALNRLGNVEVCAAAVSDGAATLRMAEGDSPSEFHADPAGAWEIRAVALDDWLATGGGRPPDLVKIDVEGSEAAVLRGGARALAAHRPSIHLALHGEQERRECGALLAAWGYRLASLDPGRDVESSSEWAAEPA